MNEATYTVEFAGKMTEEAISLIGSMGPKPGPDSCTHHLDKMAADQSLSNEVRRAANDGLQKYYQACRHHSRRAAVARSVEGALAIRRNAGIPARLSHLADICSPESIEMMVTAGVIVVFEDRYDVVVWGNDAVKRTLDAMDLATA